MNALREIRIEQGVSANKLAVMCGVTRQQISNIEHGKVNPSVELAKKMAKILGCDWTVFYRDNS